MLEGLLIGLVLFCTPLLMGIVIVLIWKQLISS
jgi:hypothetical protein